MGISAAIMMAWCLSTIAVGQAGAGRRIKDVRPAYPSASREAGDEGVVLLELNVTPAGTVGQARVLWSRCRRLEEAALAAALQWRYAQVRVNGNPVPFTIVVHVPFRLPVRLKERAGRIGACKWTEPPKPVS
jgi:TonB family protein